MTHTPSPVEIPHEKELAKGVGTAAERLKAFGDSVEKGLMTMPAKKLEELRGNISKLREGATLSDETKKKLGELETKIDTHMKRAADAAIDATKKGIDVTAEGAKKGVEVGIKAGATASALATEGAAVTAAAAGSLIKKVDSIENPYLKTGIIAGAAIATAYAVKQAWQWLMKKGEEGWKGGMKITGAVLAGIGGIIGIGALSRYAAKGSEKPAAPAEGAPKAPEKTPDASGELKGSSLELTPKLDGKDVKATLDMSGAPGDAIILSVDDAKYTVSAMGMKAKNSMLKSAVRKGNEITFTTSMMGAVRTVNTAELEKAAIALKKTPGPALEHKINCKDKDGKDTVLTLKFEKVS